MRDNHTHEDIKEIRQNWITFYERSHKNDLFIFCYNKKVIWKEYLQNGE